MYRSGNYFSTVLSSIETVMLYFCSYALPSNDVEVVKVTSAAQRRVESMERDITLTSHKRVVQVREMKSIALPIILQLLMYHVPQSVHFMVIPVRNVVVTFFFIMSSSKFGVEIVVL